MQFFQPSLCWIDWPVRMLLVQGEDGSVWEAWTDFGGIDDRCRISDKSAQFVTAIEVAIQRGEPAWRLRSA